MTEDPSTAEVPEEETHSEEPTVQEEPATEEPSEPIIEEPPQDSEIISPEQQEEHDAPTLPDEPTDQLDPPEDGQDDQTQNDNPENLSPEEEVEETEQPDQTEENTQESTEPEVGDEQLHSNDEIEQNETEEFNQQQPPPPQPAIIQPVLVRNLLSPIINVITERLVEMVNPSANFDFLHSFDDYNKASLEEIVASARLNGDDVSSPSILTQIKTLRNIVEKPSQPPKPIEKKEEVKLLPPTNIPSHSSNIPTLRQSKASPTKQEQKPKQIAAVPESGRKSRIPEREQRNNLKQSMTPDRLNKAKTKDIQQSKIPQPKKRASSLDRRTQQLNPVRGTISTHSPQGAVGNAGLKAGKVVYVEVAVPGQKGQKVVVPMIPVADPKRAAQQARFSAGQRDPPSFRQKPTQAASKGPKPKPKNSYLEQNRAKLKR
ncbi:hypothetical protein BLNAU_1759 [Blattamonas nauphoetae]|uniref:Uncharacterized protein n=1 Tax=Blattamonas nauphoetae TaxID=2049346 RepID=A0ABQ9YHJ0_9EUKA|nr:hypothetical protein BLNAU_1759 [Blattamonas nauphoetae]